MVEPVSELQQKLAAKVDWGRSIIITDKEGSQPVVVNKVDLKDDEQKNLAKAFDDSEETK